MKHLLSLVFTLLLVSFPTLSAEETRTYEHPLRTRLDETIAAKSRLPEKIWKPDPGQGIYMTIMLFSENRNREAAEQVIADHCRAEWSRYALAGHSL